MVKRKGLKSIGAAAVALMLVFMAACSAGGTAAMQNNAQTTAPAATAAAATPSPTPAPTPSPTPLPAPTALSSSDIAQLFAYDATRPFNARETKVTVTASGVKIHEMVYDAYDKTINQIGAVTFYLVEPKGDGPFPFVLYLHWLGNINGDKKEFLNEATALADKGIGGFLISGFCPWMGLPTGDVEKDKAHIVYQVIELRRAIDYISSLPWADPKRIAYVGHDYGAMFGALLSGVDKRINSFVLMCGEGDFSHWYLEYWVKLSDPAAQQAYHDALFPLDPANYVAISDAPRFFQFANDDDYIPKDTANAFYAAAAEPKEVKFYDTDHSMRDDTATADRDAWLLDKLK